MHRDVRLPLLDLIGTAHRRGLHALLTRTFVDVDLRDHEVVDVRARLRVLRVGDGRAEELLEVLRHRLAGEAEDVERFLDLLAAHQVGHETDLLGRRFQVSESCGCFHNLDPSLYSG
jgi:hypothetical protein